MAAPHCYAGAVLPEPLRPFFWDVNPDTFNPLDWPEYTIFRLLEFGDDAAVAWLRDAFPAAKIIEVLRQERRLSRRSANFWALIYGVDPADVAALQPAASTR